MNSSIKHPILLFLNILLINSYIILPFSYINQKTNNSIILTNTTKNYFESIFYNSIYSTIKVNNKNIKFHLSTERYATFISDTIKTQLLNNNSSFEPKQYSLEYIGINRGKFFNQNFTLITNNTENYLNYNISLFSIDEIVNFEQDLRLYSIYPIDTEEIGFNILKGNQNSNVKIRQDDYNYYYDLRNLKNLNDDVKGNDGYRIEQKTNLINQLKHQDIINSHTFFIKYNSKNEEGEIIIGGAPHEYDPKHFSERFFMQDFVTLRNYPPYNWHTTFSNIKYNNQSCNNSLNAKFAIDFGFIVSNMNYRDYFYDKFFGKYIKDKICYEEFINNYSIFRCKEYVIKFFKNIDFYLSTDYYPSNEVNKLTFEYKDLFEKSSNDNFYYFQIVFKGSDDWILGRPLFKKYTTVFDQDKKFFGFYSEIGNYEISYWSDFKSYFILFIIFILILIAVKLGANLYVKTMTLKEEWVEMYELKDRISTNDEILGDYKSEYRKI